MKHLKFKLSVMALVLGLGSAFATVKHHDPTDHKWRLSGSTYLDITGEQIGVDYSCQTGTTLCTVTYAQGVDPNVDDSNPVSRENGIFQ